MYYQIKINIGTGMAIRLSRAKGDKLDAARKDALAQIDIDDPDSLRWAISTLAATLNDRHPDEIFRDF